jgi:HTH-type transcriptional regulator / antitoxin HipB
MINDLGKAVRHHRKKAKLTQQELANLARVARSIVFDIERGRMTIRAEGLFKVLTFLNIELSWNSPLKSIFLKSASNPNSLEEEAT